MAVRPGARPVLTTCHQAGTRGSSRRPVPGCPPLARAAGRAGWRLTVGTHSSGNLSPAVMPGMMLDHRHRPQPVIPRAIGLSSHRALRRGRKPSTP